MKKKILSVGVVLLVLIAVVAIALYFTNGSGDKKSDTDIRVEITVAAGNFSETHIISTKCLYLGDALLEAGLIKGEEGQYGLFITEVAGISADADKEEWWCITREGESVQLGISNIEIKNNDKYELTLKTGF